MPQYNIGGQNYGSLIAYKKESQIKYPASRLVFIDSKGTPGYGGGWYFVANGSAGYVDFRHNGYANAAFADGHVEAKKYQQLYQAAPAWLYSNLWGWPGQ